MIPIVFSSAKNIQYTEIAVDAGMQPGAQLPNRTYFAPVFVDQDWKNPDRDAYITALRAHKPYLASVLDWERPDQLPEVLAWAEEAAAYAEHVIVVPKVVGGVGRIPDCIGGRPVILGYSIPTSHGGTSVPYHEFGERPVHLLGGSPEKQMRLTALLNVFSVDSNYIQKMANRCQYWSPQLIDGAKNRRFPQLQETDGWTGEGANYEAFARSANNVMQAWRKLLTGRAVTDLPLFRGMN